MNAKSGFRFPFETFRSAAAFRDFARTGRTLLELRQRYEAERAAAARGQLLVAPGTCGLCLRETRFTTAVPAASTDHAAAPGPAWREEQGCDCAERLTCRWRGLLQFLDGEIAPPPWTRLLLLGDGQAIEPRLRRRCATVTVHGRGGQGGLGPPPASPCHLVVSCDHLHAEAAPDETLAAIHAALAPGGTLLLTAPFDAAAADSVAAGAGRPGRLGWDILDRLARAGFAAPAAHLFWSEEFGYLGAGNMIFSAAS